MKVIAAGKAKAQFLGLLDDVRNKREAVVVTKHGRQWAKIVPLDLEQGEDPLEVFRFPGKIEIHGDIVSAPFTDEELNEFERASLEPFR